MNSNNDFINTNNNNKEILLIISSCYELTHVNNYCKVLVIL